MSERLPASPPPYMDFPDIWDLADEPNPELLKQYLDWVFKDEDRLESAAEAMQRVAEFNALHVAVERDETGLMTRSLQLNFYSRFTGGNEDPHGHSRDASAVWYSGPNTRQVVTRWEALPHAHLPEYDWLSPYHTKQPENFELRKRIANVIIDKGDGKRPGYYPIEGDVVRLRKQSILKFAPLSSITFSPHEIHDVAVQWGEDEYIAISIHKKEAEQPEEYNNPDNLVEYKGFSLDAAQEVHSKAKKMIKDLPPGSRLGPITPIYLPFDTDVSKLETNASPTGPHDAKVFMRMGRAMVGRMVKLG